MGKRTAVLIAVSVVLVATTVAIVSSRSARNPLAAGPTPSSDKSGLLVAGPGRIEPNSEDIKVGSEISGKLNQVLVEEGEQVKRGQLLAVMVNDDYRAHMESAAAQVKQREAELRKVINGARTQERREAFSTVLQAKAVLANARSQADRYTKLFEAGVVSREESERFSREYDVAKAHYEETVQHHALVDADAREEDRAMAEANLRLAQTEWEEARARYEKTLIRSPLDATVLRKHHRSGENVTNSGNSPDPIVTLGDTKALRARVDVDETEISRVRVGQSAYVTADAYGQQKFWGHVIRVGEELGRKNIRTDEPAEHVDTKILETLVQLDPEVHMPVGLRVDAFILVGQEQPSSASVTDSNK